MCVGLTSSAVLNFTKPSMDFAIEKPGVLRFIEKPKKWFFVTEDPQVCQKRCLSTPLFLSSSGERIGTTDHKIMSLNPQSVIIDISF